MLMAAAYVGSTRELTISAGRQLGRMCRQMMRMGLTPMLWAAWMYSLSLRLMVSDRATRATLAHSMRDRARKMLMTPPPRVYMMTMASSRDGNASITSARRMMT